MRVDVDEPHVNFCNAMRIGFRLGLGEQSRALSVGGQHNFDQLLGT